MNEQDRGGSATESDQAGDEVEPAWTTFTQRLGNYLAEMQWSEDETDTLVIEVPTGRDPNPEGCAPYAQFTTYASGCVRAEISGDWYLAPVYMCGDDDLMNELGWTWEAQGNWWLEAPATDAAAAARIVVASLRGCFGIAHPQLMTFHAFGPRSDRADELGLTATAELTFEDSTEAVDVARPRDRAHLTELLGDALAGMFGDVPRTDDDGDYVIGGPGQPIWVRVLREAPAIQFMAVATYDVHSRRAAAVELSILNRDSVYARWDLRDRMAWITMSVPANPLVREHVTDMYEHFVSTLLAQRADLALRCGGKVAQ